jgi:hypothetical protein
VHTMSKMFFQKKILGPCAAKDPERSATTNNRDDNKFIHKLPEALAATKLERDPYVSSGWCWNRATMSLAVSWTLALVASSASTMGPYTTGSREAFGSQLWKHVSMWSTTLSANTQPSTSSSLPTTPSSDSILAPAESNKGSTMLTSRTGSESASRPLIVFGD